MSQRWRRLPDLAPVVLAALVALVHVNTSNAQPANPEVKQKAFLEYRPPLKDGNYDRFDFKGPDPDQCVKHDAQGVRITLPAGHPGVLPETGLRVQVDVRGDFEITMSYELLHEPGPMDAGFGTRTTLGLWFDGPEKNRDATISRLRNNQGTTQFGGWAATLTDEFGNKKPRLKYVPAEAKSGRLRFVRVGADVSYFAADGADGEFQLFSKNTITPGDVKRIRMVATTGGPKAALDVRITDLVVRAEAFPDLPADQLVHRADPNGAPAPAPAAPSHAWLYGGILVAAALVMLLLFAVAAMLLRRKSSRVRDSVDAPISFACSGCGRKLTVKPELAGRKIKCSKCGAVELVA